MVILDPDHIRPRQVLIDSFYYTHNFEEVEGTYMYYFGVVCDSVRDSIHDTFLMHAISYEPCMLQCRLLKFHTYVYGFLMEK